MYTSNHFGEYMSVILKGLLQPQIAAVIAANSVATATNPGDIASQRSQLVDALSSAIAIAVQQYLLQVTVVPGQAVTVTTAGGPTNQAGGGTTVSPGLLNAP
jgi:hypothetical protein